MSDSATAKAFQQVSRFDGTNWETWSFSIKAALLFLNALGIAEGTELHSTDAAKMEDYDKRARQGLSLILTSVDVTIYQSLDINKSLKQNWDALNAQYGARTGLNLWIDFQKYTTTRLVTDTPLTQQIDALSELRARVNAAGIRIDDSLHAMIMLQSLPDSYKVVQQTLLATIDFPKATTATISNIRSRILSEELCQGSTSGVSAIKRKPDANKGKCNYCGGTGHWEKDCKRKERGLSREEAKAERKGKWKKGKGTEKKDESAASVKAVITEVKELSPGSTSNVPTPSASETACFYIACDRKWMLDSGCTDHITSNISDFTTYRTLPTPQKAWFADGKSYTTYIGIGTVKGTTKICGEP